MMTDDELSQLKTQLSLLGELSFKPYFSFLAIFKDNTMFALYKEQNLYVRKSNKYFDEIKQTLSQVHFLVDRNIGHPSKIFYLLPSHILENLEQYIHWILSAIEEYQQTKAKLNMQNKNKIRMLPNLNINIERLLSKVDIYTVEDLQRVGIMTAFVRLIEQGAEVTELFLFRLYGAIQHKYVYMLSETEKKGLLEEADAALYQAGLRKRFTV